MQNFRNIPSPKIAWVSEMSLHYGNIFPINLLTENQKNTLVFPTLNRYPDINSPVMH